MIVRHYMSTELVTVEPETKLLDAADLMKKHDIHRLPVLDQGLLLGLVTGSTIEEAMPSTATSMSAQESNYLLNKVTIKDVMIKEVLVIEPDVFLEDAAALMLENNVGALPVIENDRLVGIITDKDILKAFTDISGQKSTGTKLILKIDQDEPGVLAKVTKSFADAGKNISQVTVYHHEGDIFLTVQSDESDDQAVRGLLEAAGYQIFYMQ